MPGPDRLISLFLEGLSNKSLHEDLYGRKHDTLNECIKDAIDLNDNCELFGNVDKKVNFSDTSSAKSERTRHFTLVEADAIADLVIKKMNEMFKPAMRAPEPPRFQKPYQCGICHGDHPTFQCALKPGQPPQFHNKLWCDYEKRWTNHNTEGCWQRLKLLREKDIAQQQNQGNFPAGGEKAMPVLG